MMGSNFFVRFLIFFAVGITAGLVSIALQHSHKHPALVSGCWQVSQGGNVPTVVECAPGSNAPTDPDLLAELPLVDYR